MFAKGSSILEAYERLVESAPKSVLVKGDAR